VGRLAGLRPGRITAIAAAITALWATPASADTIVSFTFDDGWADQLPAKATLAEHDMNATFYLITDRVGNPGYFTWGDVASLHADGNEIAGHTTNHQSLTSLPPDQARAAVCDSRQALLARGYPQVSFAYPRGDNDAATEGLVQECGYLSGRDVTPIGTWEALGERETIPPANRWALRTPGTIDVNDTLAEIKDWIMDAERVDVTEGDVWIPLVFHHICDLPNPACEDPDQINGQYITSSDFDALLDWLEARESLGTHVRTIADVMAPGTSPDTTAPVTQISCDGASCQSGFYNHVVSVALSATDTGGLGVKEIRYTTNGSDPTPSSPLYTGAIPIGSTTTIKFRAWDNAGNVEAVRARTILIDTVRPTSAIRCNGGSCSSGFYNRAVWVTLSGSDTGGSGLRNIRYTTNGSTPTSSSPIYSGPIRVCSTTTIKWRAEDNAGNVESPIQSRTIRLTRRRC
jgi:peptidoglycan/xylan/chitin deacetylase (PgdA/CDA1 family)